MWDGQNSHPERRGVSLATQSGEELRRRDYERLKIMTGYCKNDALPARVHSRLFPGSRTEECGNCGGNCRRTYRQGHHDIGADDPLVRCARARNARILCRKTLIVQTLRGSRDRRLLCARAGQALNVWPDAEALRGKCARHDRPPGRSGVSAHERAALHAGTDRGRQRCAVRRREDRHAGTLESRRRRAGEKKRRRKKGASAPTTGTDDLFAALKAERTRLAAAEGVPAYVVFSNATLADMAAKAPRTMEDFLEGSRRRRDKSRALRRSVPEKSHRRIRRSGRSLKKRKALRHPIRMPEGLCVLYGNAGMI